jgi:hypothetical protein
MARKRAPKPPPIEAQREAATWTATGKLWRGVQVTKGEHTRLDMLDEWLLRQYDEGAKLAPSPRGAPPKWGQMLDAVRWLRVRCVKLSDAPGSKCVAALTEFLDQTRTAECRSDRDSTAEQLAGTLIAIARTVEGEGGQ